MMSCNIYDCPLYPQAAEIHGKLQTAARNEQRAKLTAVLSRVTVFKWSFLLIEEREEVVVMLIVARRTAA